jgi:hypothetical protein
MFEQYLASQGISLLAQFGRSVMDRGCGLETWEYGVQEGQRTLAA